MYFYIVYFSNKILNQCHRCLSSFLRLAECETDTSTIVPNDLKDDFRHYQNSM